MRAVRAVVHNAKLLKLQCPSIDYPGEMKKEEQNVFVATTQSFAKFYSARIDPYYGLLLV